MALTTGGSRVDLNFIDTADLAAASIPDNRGAVVQDGQRYVTATLDAGSGVLLASGNYANPIAEPSTTKVIPQTGGGTLTALRINELHDGSTYTLPLANSVDINQIITIALPDTFKAFAPVVQRAGADLIRNSTGVHSDFDFASPTTVQLTSNGVDEWSI